MTLNAVGEFGFIKKISRGCLIRPDNVIKPIGDDAAAFTVAPDLVSLITTDLMVERIHFIRNSITGFDLGYKSLAVNLSDIAAMGGNACEAFVSIAIPPDCSLEYVEAFYEGMKSLAARFDVNILGGDTTGSKDDLIINIAVHGTVDRSQILCRDAACPGDIIVSSGYLGDSKAGLYLILNNIPTDTEDLRALYRAHVLPDPHLHEGRFLASQPGAHAGIDVSDGLSSDLGHIAEESQVGATLYSDKIPVSESLLKFCSRYGYDPVDYALSGGEDYTLLCTIAPESAEETAARFQAEFKRPLFLIGEISEKSGLKITYPDGSSKPITPTGWNHFMAG
ncbi:MAG: thiamine-phosphate kinase [Desulfobacteraceae bacterium]|jgi:thiamine-monophosphate kinase|nr:thiamine-phosphate kinase [Desulfobacteraceae bacterium]